MLPDTHKDSAGVTRFRLRMKRGQWVVQVQQGEIIENELYCKDFEQTTKVRGRLINHFWGNCLN